MIKLEYQLIAYHDDRINRYWIAKPNLKWPNKTLKQTDIKQTSSLSQIITQDLSNRFNQLKIKDSQIQFNCPKLTNQELILPVIIYLAQDQATQIINDQADGQFFNDAQIPDDLPKNLKTDNQNIKVFLNDDLQAHALKNIHYLLPKTFTAKQLSALLTIITNRPIKRNNIRRDFLSQTKIVGKDHSHAGYPSNLFQYDNTNFNIKDKPKLKGQHRI